MGKKNIPYIEETYDVVVVGAGHAGCEAALACARLGLETMMFTVSVDSIALMPCNPNIGGSSKGHLVREIDALGGEMGKNIDKTFIQSKMLNKSKGPAVHSLRAQADKAEYTKEMRKTLQNTDHLSIRQAEVAEILTNKDQFFPEDEYHEGEEQKITGVRTVSGGVYRCKAVVLCTGTYLRARCLTGEMITHTGPNGLSAANHLTDSLVAHGIQTRRFKTGTPARVDKRSLDFSKMEEQFGDERVVPFSFTTNPEDVQIEHYENLFRHFEWKYHGRVSANIFYSNERSHKIYAACDAFLMPSLFEPCGLSQLMSLRYGTVPIVRETGGLKDTVEPYNEYEGKGTGFSFANYNAHEMLATIRYAKDVYYNRKSESNKIIDRGMAMDFSWNHSAKKYEDMYNELI